MWSPTGISVIASIAFEQKLGIVKTGVEAAVYLPGPAIW